MNKAYNILDISKIIGNITKELSSLSIKLLKGKNNINLYGKFLEENYRFPVFQQEAAAGVGRLDISDAYSMEEFVVDNIPNEAVFVMKIAGDRHLVLMSFFIIYLFLHRRSTSIAFDKSAVCV